MAFSAVSCFAGLECLGAVVTLAAILACIHVCHGVLATLLHRKDLGMAVIALQALSAWDLPSNTTLPAPPPSYSTVFPGALQTRCPQML